MNGIRFSALRFNTDAPKVNVMTNKILKFLASEDGPTAVEYAVMLGLIIVVCLAAIVSIGESTNANYETIRQAMEQATQ